MGKENKEATKLEYHAPRLERYGTLSELTQAGHSVGGNDFILYKDGQLGSVPVNPPGLGGGGPPGLG